MKKFKYKKQQVIQWNTKRTIYRLYRRSWFLFFVPSHLTFETEDDAIRFCKEMN